MKAAAIALALVLTAAPAYAQLGGIGKGIRKANEAKDTVRKVSDLHFSDKEERALGENISTQLMQRFGVYQDPAVAKYVTLVGTVLAQASSRPNLAWEFIVLDSENVNAYAAPGGLVHITKGALGLMKDEAELAGVLGHEITHVTAKHTINAIQKSKTVSLGATEFSGDGLTGAGIAKLSTVGYEVLLENKFDRKEEMESDKTGVQIASTVGYAPRGMIGFLTKIAERNKGRQEPNGVFASHPQTTDRIAAMEKLIRDDKLAGTARVTARYTATIKFDATPAEAIAMDIAGVKGAVGDSGAKPKDDEKAKADEKNKKRSGGLLGGMGLTKGSQAQNTQTVASAGSRGGVPDRDAVGGPNKSKVRIPALTPAEIEAFKKGIAA
jgi:predicted Zn-dependent protease